jgi:hypothetical protein
MLSYSDAAAIAAAPISAPVDRTLARLLADRVHDWTVTDLLSCTHLVIAQPGDTEEDFVEQTTLSPLVNPLDGSRFGSADFVPAFDWFQQHGRWFELMWAFSSGHAVFAFIEDAEETDPELLALCRTCAEDAGPGEQSCE